MKSMKTLFLQLVSLAIGAFLIAVPAVAAQPSKAVLVNETAMNQTMLEAMWTAGGQEYRDAVVILARDYKDKMDKQCRVKNFDISPASAVYRVYAPAGTEFARNKMILRQVATMACIMNPYLRDGAKVAEKLKM